MKNKLLFYITIFISYVSMAQVPNGYYNDAYGLSGEELREALHQIIDNHSSKSYDNLWSYFNTTDKKSNGKVWDMYSDGASYEYTFSTNQCGNYSQEGDCYNREHSFPKNWFGGDVAPMNSDLFHIYPTDGWVNGKRSNYPYGEVGSTTYTSQNGSKVGTSVTTGYSGTVFEPIDSYKGDFARTYFYMVTRYKDVASGWSSDMLTGNNLSGWAIDLLLAWDEADPVSQKEIDRNNAVYNIQNNRNPYIDEPNYVDYVWGGVEPDTTTNDLRDKVNMSMKITYTAGVISVTCDCEIESIDVFNVLGEKLYSQTTNVNSTTSLHLPRGVYIATVNGFGQRFLVD